MEDGKWRTDSLSLPSILYSLLSILLLLSALPVQAQIDQGFEFEKSGSAGFQFLKIALGARESALGEAAAAMTNDANAVFWNVGALPLIGERQVAFTHNEWIVDSSLDALVVAAPVGPYAVGLSLVRFGIEPFEETTVLEPDGTGRMVEAGDVMIGLAGARRFTDRLTIGVQAKYVIEMLDNDRFQNVLFDVGALYYTGFRQLRLAFTLQHFGPDTEGLEQSFRTPLLFRVAAADDLVRFDQVRVSGAVELVHPTDNEEWVNGGVEAVLLDVLALRAGYRVSVDEGAWSVGAGVVPPRVEGVGVRADYAYVGFGDLLGATHRFTVSLGL
ncbi:MAG: PorV/PorQ family protein [Bacteroidota bacterium]